MGLKFLLKGAQSKPKSPNHQNFKKACRPKKERGKIHSFTGAEEKAMEKSKMVEAGGNNNDSSSMETGFGNNFSDLTKSFSLALRSLLTSCSNQEFNQAFSTFTDTETQFLHRLFLQLITSLHENIEEEFKSICLRTKVGATLDAVEEVIEERDLDPLFSEGSNIMDVAEDLSAAKKNEIQHLKEMVQLGEEKNQMLRSRLQLLREGRQVSSGAFQAVGKLRSMNLSYGANISDK